MSRYFSLSWLLKLLRRPWFWLILILLALISVSYYSDVIKHPSFISSIWLSLGLDRHAFERILYLAIIVWAGFLFGWRGAFIISLVALAIMLPRDISISAHPRDAFLETGAVFLLGNIMSAGFASLRREREYRRKLEVAHQQLRLNLRQAARAQEDERKRISHELHDDTVQELVVLSRQLDSLAADKTITGPARLRLQELWQQTDNILQGVRRLSQDLRPAVIDQLGLLPAVQWLVEDMSRYSAVATKVEVIGKERQLPEEVAVALFRIIQEAMRNIWRHSGAASAEIIIEFLDKHTRITIRDDGKGFNPPDESGDLAREGKLGLAGMQERARFIGGTLTVQSVPEKGTTITVEAPG
ncbi:MAG: sensor histidine kinase [Dehalococcoidales bacterium]